jgi:hypothetical protein
VLKLIAEGHTSKEIAAMLVISIKTVDRHRTNMLDKLGIRDRVELTRYAIPPRPDRALATEDQVWTSWRCRPGAERLAP